MNEPVVRLARSRSEDDEHNTLVLEVRAWLAVQVFFLDEYMEGLEVCFFKASENGQPGEAVGGTLQTDNTGIAKLDGLVPAGGYFCQIEHQPEILITTTSDLEDPYQLALPIGRPLFHRDYELGSA